VTILSVIQNASIKIGINRPSQIYALTDRTSYDVQAIIAEAVDAIRDAHDWQILKAITTLTGDAVTTAFTLPTDYDRMLVTANLWSSRYQWAMEHVTDSDRWIEYLTLTSQMVNGVWSIFGGNLNLLDTGASGMATGDTAKFFYIKNTIVRDAMSQPKAAFTADSDTFAIDEELLRLCFIWKWKQEKGRDYAEDLANYEQKRYKTIDKDGGSKPVITGRMRTSWKTPGVAWPGSISPVVP
jgi:hypothetical protein